jgi:hypothetical protein
VASQRNLSNSFIVTECRRTTTPPASSGIPLAVESVEQFQITWRPAELGRSAACQVVTCSGAIALRGRPIGTRADDSLNAANPPGQTLPMHQNQYGLRLSGPIAKDRTFFFANVEQRDLDQSGLTTITDANVAAINGRLAATGYPGSAVATGVYPNPVRATLGLAKLDHHAGSHQLGLRYSLYRVAADNSRGAGGFAAPSASAGLDDVDHAVSFSDSWVLSNRTVNETRVLYAYGDLKAPPTDPVGPAVSISGVASFGTASGSPTRRTNTLVEVVDTLSHQAGAHALRAGADFL